LFQLEDLHVRQRSAVVVFVGVIIKLLERQADAIGGTFAATLKGANNCTYDFPARS
jgi:hypothetical protein